MYFSLSQGKLDEAKPQQEQALAQSYGESGEAAGHAGFGASAEQTAEEEQQHWIPAEEIEEVQAEDVLEESEATYEQLLELDEQKVVVGLSERAKAQATTVVKLTDSSFANSPTSSGYNCHFAFKIPFHIVHIDMKHATW